MTIQHDTMLFTARRILHALPLTSETGCTIGRARLVRAGFAPDQASLAVRIIAAERDALHAHHAERRTRRG